MASYLFLISKGTYLQKLQEPRNTPVSKHIISSVIAAIRGVVNMFPDRIFRARTECSYHTSR